MDQKHEILQQYFGYTEFREGQGDLIQSILDGRDVLGIMPTGSGKSLCYQIPALIFPGITLVISPLISLMNDQVAALKTAGVSAAYLNSTLSPAQLRTAYKRMRMGMYQIIYVAPERLQTYDFLWAVQDLEISMIAVDEAHCISQWGQDFRPSYLKIVDFLHALPKRPVLSAFTATATETVAQDIQEALELSDPVRLVTGFDRPNLYFETRRPPKKREALLELMEERKGKSGIIYCATRKETDDLCQLLQDRGYPATRYHAGLPEAERLTNQTDFICDAKPIMVATNAFGMGIDKSNVSYVIHYNMPKSMEAYYQEAGRAGRDGTPADCILLYSAKDVQTAKFLIQTPSEKSELTPEQQAQITAQDYKRLDSMIGYCHTKHCLRAYILDYFGQKSGESCGNCGNCSGTYTEQDITVESRRILSCVVQVREMLGYHVGENLIVKILRGSRLQRLHDLGLHHLPTYGSLSAYKEKGLEEVISTLKEEGFLRSNHIHGTLEATSTTDQVLLDGKTVTMRIRSTRKLPRTLQTLTGNPLFDRLKVLRNHLAAKERVPAYIIFSNATLQDMSEKHPHTMEELLQVSGVGKFKAEKYGERFLEELNKV